MSLSMTISVFYKKINFDIFKNGLIDINIDILKSALIDNNINIFKSVDISIIDMAHQYIKHPYPWFWPRGSGGPRKSIWVNFQIGMIIATINTPS